MRNFIDVHTHSVLSTHAYSTLWENVKIAKEKGLKYYGISDHAPAIPGGQTMMSISNLRILPEYIEGIRVLKGIELNIIDGEGNYDVPESLVKRLDYTIASYHPPVISGLSRDEVTTAYLNLCDDKYITVLGHVDDARFDCDFEKVISRCAETNTLVEINDNSVRPTSSRVNGRENVRKILELAKSYSLPVIINSDAHICFDVGRIEEAMEFVREVDFPAELIVNFNEKLIDKYFIRRVTADS